MLDLDFTAFQPNGIRRGLGSDMRCTVGNVFLKSMLLWAILPQIVYINTTKFLLGFLIAVIIMPQPNNNMEKSTQNSRPVRPRIKNGQNIGMCLCFL